MLFTNRLLGAATHRLSLILALHRHRSKLSAGLYIIRANLAYRLGSQIPGSLLKSRGNSPLLLIWPLLGRYRGSLGGQALCLSRAESVIILNLFNGSFERVAKSMFNRKYSYIRNEMSRFLPAPRYKINRERSSISEDIVEGDHLSECCDSLNLIICTSIIQSLCKIKMKFAPGDFLRDYEESPAWTSFLVPSHGDLGSNNIIVSGNSIFTIIDWDPYMMGLRPPWYDPLTLIGSSDFLREAYVEGAFNLVFQNTFPELAGSRSERLNIIETRHLLLAVKSI